MLSLDDVQEFFKAVLQRDEATLKRIEDGPDDARIEQQQFVFSLAALLELLDKPETSMKTFRKLLYSSELNRQLRTRGAEITVFHDSGKIDSNLYSLKAT